MVVVRSAAQRVALHVDEVLGNQEVVVKNLGPQLSRLPGMAGISVLASGAVVLIYNPVALAAVHGDRPARCRATACARRRGRRPPAAPAHRAATTAAARVPLVLVVDDSITVRRVTQRLLQREGYRVALAADGLQALERLQQERPAVVLSDIEMPRMDGFDLARNIRADAALADLPIIMITSRIAEKHREHATQLGVNHYLGKPYSEEELLRLVRSYASAEAGRRGWAQRPAAQLRGSAPAASADSARSGRTRARSGARPPSAQALASPWLAHHGIALQGVLARLALVDDRARVVLAQRHARCLQFHRRARSTARGSRASGSLASCGR